MKQPEAEDNNKAQEGHKKRRRQEPNRNQSETVAEDVMSIWKLGKRLKKLQQLEELEMAVGLPWSPYRIPCTSTDKKS